jgi:CBS domain-containing protein
MPDLDVRALMRGGVVTATPGTALDEAARLMGEREASGLVVMDGETAVGLILSTDLIDPAVVPPSLLRRRSRTARDVMSTPVVSIPVEASLHEALAVLRQHRAHRLVVTGGSDPAGARPVGVLTMSDILRALGRVGPDGVMARPGPAQRPWGRGTSRSA